MLHPSYGAVREGLAHVAATPCTLCCRTHLVLLTSQQLPAHCAAGHNWSCSRHSNSLHTVLQDTLGLAHVTATPCTLCCRTHLVLLTSQQLPAHCAAGHIWSAATQIPFHRLSLCIYYSDSEGRPFPSQPGVQSRVLSFILPSNHFR